MDSLATRLSRATCPTTDEEKQRMAQYPYRSIIGQLNYLQASLRADISFWFGYLARFMDNPGYDHWLALLNLLAHIRDYPHAQIIYRDPSEILYSVNGVIYNMEPNRLYCFVDADFATSDPDKRRSVTGYVIFFNGGIISWKSVLQRRTSSSSTEAEYRALHEAARECIWLTHILNELGFPHTSPVMIFEDNTSTIAATVNPVAHSKLKHLETIYHQTRDFIADGKIKVVHIDTEHQLADQLTKQQPLNRNIILVNSIMHVYKD